MTIHVDAAYVATTITNMLEKYTKDVIDVKEPELDGKDWMPKYTASPEYLTYLGAFHMQPEVTEFMRWLLETIPIHEQIWDVGCVCGYTGMAFVMNGFNVAFHDFEGIGLDFLRWIKDEKILGDLKFAIVPYGKPAPRLDWAIALDVIEHTTNQFAFLRWMSDLGRRVAFTFPTAMYKEPFCLPLDQWIDREAVSWIVEQRHTVIRDEIGSDGRTYIVFE